MSFARTRAVLGAALEGGVFPGAAVLVADGGTVRFEHAVGMTERGAGARPVGPQTFYDVASLTKVMATVTVAMRLSDRGRLDPDDPVSRWVPEFAAPGRAGVSLAQLLAHCSGLPAHRRYYEQRAGREAILAAAAAEPPEAPPGTRAAYSDVGFLVLGQAVERAGGARIDALFREEVASPLGLAATYVDLEAPSPLAGREVAATADCPWRGRVLRGEVHDENAWAMGGVAPHAGLFATARDAGRLAGALVAAWAGDPAWIRPATVRRFWETAPLAGSTRRLGWDTPSATGSSAGERFARRAVGHLGFTGCSLWIDPERARWVVVLSNRVHPSAADERIKELRPRLHDAVVEDLET